MTHSGLAILRGASWTLSSYLASFAFRFATNVVLAYLLAPEIFGIMLIVNSVRLGVELTSDLGIGQNIIHSAKSDDPDFYNTAWTIQLVRGLALFVIAVLAAEPISRFYDIPALVFQISALGFVFTGATSLSLSLAVKRMTFISRNVFDAAVDLVSLLVLIGMTYVSPTVWALVIGGVIGSAIRCLASFLLPSPRHRLVLSYPYAVNILTFGKWIFASSLVYFACTNFDRLYLGKVVPLEIVGLFGIARAIADLPAHLAVRLSHFIVFPLVSSWPSSRMALREQLARLRIVSFFPAAALLAAGIATSDALIALIYDARYQGAGWMLPLLLVGVWVSLLCSFNEAALLGVGKPIYGAIANTAKLAFLVIGLPLAFQRFGLAASIIVIAVSDFFRYVPLLFGQARERLSFAWQDLIFTLFLIGLVALLTGLRWHMGWGTPLNHMPPFG